jgi:phage terminase large subunit-like protein
MNDASISSYNQANKLIEKADICSVKKPDWYLSTADLRRKARHLFQKTADSSSSKEIKGRAITNLGNSLYKANRWVEAYDNYCKALESDPSNAVASMMAAKVLHRCIDRSIGNKKVLQAVAAKHLKSAELNIERLQELAGKQAVEQLQQLLKTNFHVPQISFKAESQYEKFVNQHRLALSPTIEGLEASLKRWDNLKIFSVTESMNKDGNVPPIFAMFNTLKSDFLVARRMAFDAITDTLNDSGSYSDTLDYAVYGVQSSMLILAQRASLDILDKIAVAVTEHLELGDKKDGIYFHNRWFAKQDKNVPSLSWHPGLLKSINSGNGAIVALAEMALDIGNEGFLNDKRKSRHAGTHRFVVLHDIGKAPSRECSYVEHSTVKDFKQETLDSLRLARSAIIYFVELIALEERTRRNGAKIGFLEVPDYHSIRGED